MQLLECDDFRPFESSKSAIKHRPHTTDAPPSKTVTLSLLSSSKSAIKSADYPKKRASVIDPPLTFQDVKLDHPDEFEMLENLINDHFNDEKDNFFLNKQNKDDLNLILNERKYSDDLSSIDSSLINEHDNLSIPEHFQLDSYSPTSTEDTDTTIQNDDDVDLFSLQYDKKISKIEPIRQNNFNMKSKKSNRSNSSKAAARNLFEPIVQKPVLKTKGDVDDYFTKNKRVPSSKVSTCHLTI